MLFDLDDQGGAGRLDREECLRLLEADNVGRLAIVQGDTPAIFPINYVMDGDSIVFRTAPGTKLLHGPRRLVAFEIDFLSREERSGWSVVVIGRLEEVTHVDPELYAHVRNLDIRPWAEGAKQHWMRLVPGLISGRRVGHESP